MAIKNYNSFSNDYSSYTMPSSGFGDYTQSMNMLDNPFVQTRYNTNPFLKGYSYADADVSKLVQGFNKTLQDSYLLGNEPGGRSALDRVFDTLLVGNYASAGLAKAAIDPNLNAFQAVGNALKAANPFGKGYKPGEYTYSGVLEQAGWKPESGIGKFAKGTLGFVGDVLLDPLTYLTGGTSALLKGSGKLGHIGAGGEKIAKMTIDDAMKIVEDTSVTRNMPLDAAQMEKDATKLADQYNKLQGIRDTGNITFGLGNLPFVGNKLGTPAVLGTDEVFKKIGDQTLAPLYTLLRDTFYNSSLGQKLSTKTAMYRLANDDPSKLYDFIKFVDTTKGLNLDKQASEKLIRDKSKMFNLSPYEEKQVLGLMQNKSIWETIRPIVQLGKTKEGEGLREQLQVKQQANTSRLAELTGIKSEVDVLKQNGANHGAELDALQTLYRNTLIDFDVKTLKTTQDLLEHNRLIKAEIDAFDKSVAPLNVDELVAKFDSYATIKKSADPSVGKASNVSIVDDLNKHLYGGNKTISYTAPDKEISTLIDMLKGGTSKDMIKGYVDSKPRIFSGSAQAIYSYVASKLGYKIWDEAFSKPLGELSKKTVDGGTLTKSDLQQLETLYQLKLKREAMLALFKDANTTLDVENVIKRIENTELENSIDEVGNLFNSTGRAKDDSLDATRVEWLKGQNPRETIGKAEVDYTDVMSRNDKGESYLDFVDVDRGAEGVRSISLTREDRTLMTQNVLEQMGWRAGKRAFTEQQQNIVKILNKEIENVLLYGVDDVHFKIPYSQMNEKQLNYLFSLAKKNAIKNHPELFQVFQKNKTVQKKENDAVQEVKKSLTKAEFREKVLADIAKFKEARKLDEQALTRRADMLKQIEDNDLTISSFKDTRDSLVDDFKQRIEEMEVRVRDANKTHEKLFTEFDQIDGNEIRRLEFEITRLDKALTDDDAYETYLQYTLSRSERESIIKANSVVMTALDANMDVSERVKEMVRVLRGEMRQIAIEEVEIGKLTAEQARAFHGDYLPHIPTAEAQKFFADHRETIDKATGLTKDTGYGNKFSPHSLTRKVKVEIDGKWIENPTIEQLNQYFSEKHGLKQAYVDSITDLYIARAMKHTELMYDDAYMHTMMTTFGTLHNVGDEIKKGHTAVVNYGLLRNNLIELGRDYHVMHEGVPVKLPTDIAVRKMLTDVGLDEKILADFKVPMVELSREQANALTKLSGNFQVVQVNDAIAQKANQARKIQMARDQSDMLKIFDKVTHLLKLNMTTVMPSFHIRNKLANMYLNWLGVGKDAFSPQLQVQAWRAVKTKGTLTDKRIILVNDGAGNQVAMDWNEIYNVAKSQGVIDEGFFAKDIGSNTRTTGVLPRVKPKYDPTDSENFVLYKKGGAIGNQIENSDRLVHFAALLKQGKTVDEAAEHARQFLFDYSDLTAFEQNVMKRIIPFYTWLRKNSALQVEQLIEQPEKFRFVAKSLNGIEGMTNEEDRVDPYLMNSFAKDWVQLPFMMNGKPNVLSGKSKKEPIMLNPNLPFNDIGRIPDPFNLKDTIKELFTQMNPIAKVPIEQINNKNYFLEDQIVKKGESQVAQRADHVASQLAMYGALKGIVTKDGTDAALHAGNFLTGVKTMGYDYENQKKEAIRNKLNEIKYGNSYDNPFGDLFNNINNTGVKGLKQVSKAVNVVTDGVTRLADDVNKSKPDAFMYTDAFRPISKSAYDKLSDAEKEMYNPPTEEEAFSYNKQAIALAQKAYDETGVAKKFMWAMFKPFESSKERTVGHVLHVTDGDTFNVQIGDDKHDIRMLLIDTPETVKPNTPAMPFGKEGSDHTKSRLENKEVKIYFEGAKKDKYDRLLGYIEVDGVDYGKELIEQGFAQTRYVNGNYSRKKDYQQAEQQASTEGNQVWSVPGYATPRVDDDYNMAAYKRYIDKLAK